MKQALLPFLTTLIGLSATAQDQVTRLTVSTEGMRSDEITYMTATVSAVDLKARSVTLKGQEGEEMTMSVSDKVERLAEVKVGDKLDVGYLRSIGLDFRAPTEEELKTPWKETGEVDRTDRASAPGGVAARMIRAVVTLEGMSRWMNTLTVRSPKGNYFIVEVKPEMVKWEELRIGQQMVGSYTESVVMSIEPAAKKK